MENFECCVGADKAHTFIETCCALILPTDVENHCLRPHLEGPGERSAHEGPTQSQSGVLGVYRDAMEIGDTPLTAEEGISHRHRATNRKQYRSLVGGEGVRQTSRAHTPESVKRCPVDIENWVPIRVYGRKDIVVGGVMLASYCHFHDVQRCERIEPRPVPYSGGRGVQGRRVDRFTVELSEGSHYTDEKLGTTSIETNHWILDHLVPRSCSRPEPSGIDGDGPGPYSFNTQKTGHVWESKGMEVLVATSPAALRHDTGPRHPERPERVEAVMRGIEASGLPIQHLQSPEISRSELALVHDASYLEMIETFCELGGGALDMDTFASPESWEAALTAAGGVRALLEELVVRNDTMGFAVSRPPGHHAMPDRAMGFCLFNNVAVAAAVARSRGERVAILDWDVHHGNGTQAMLANDPGALYISVHQAPFYPFEGTPSDIDDGEAKGTVVNVPLAAGTGGNVYRRVWEEIVLPVTSQFAPDWVFISAGYDAHRSDQLADLNLSSDDYGWMSQRITTIHPPQRTIVTLEGGYDLDALNESANATVRGFSGVDDWSESLGPDTDSRHAVLDEAKAIVGRHWSV